MQKKLCFSIIIIISFLLIISCTDGDKSTSPDINMFENFEDVVIPDNFNFEASRTLDITFYGSVDNTVTVVGNDGKVYHKSLIDYDNPNPRSISIPNNISSLDFHYRENIFAGFNVKELINNSEVYLVNFVDEEEKRVLARGNKDRVEPIMEGIEINGDDVTSHWGYNNTTGSVQTISKGDDNYIRGNNNFSPKQNQVEEFLPGRHEDVFTVDFPNDGTQITWKVKFHNAINESASNQSPLIPMPDEDDDGVPDDEDDYPQDPDKAYDNYYPNQDVKGTLAYEDLWPEVGDYDFNDMVLHYNIKEVVNSDDEIVQIDFDIDLVAVGARRQNGFYIELPIDATDVSLIETNQPQYTQLMESSNLAIVQVFNSSNDIVQISDFMNTVQEEPFTPYGHITFSIAVASGYNRNELVYSAPYNPFITINHDRSMEVHLPGMPPTEHADVSYFNNSDNDDATDVDAGITYKTESGQPWALHVAHIISHPRENIDIVKAYPAFGVWIESAGLDSTDWYLNPVEDYIFSESRN